MQEAAAVADDVIPPASDECEGRQPAVLPWYDDDSCGKHSVDDLEPARGILTGVLLGAILWLLILCGILLLCTIRG